MKNVLVSCVMVVLCALMVQARSLGNLDCALVPNADMVYVQDMQATERSAFGKQVLKRQEEWSRKMDGTEKSAFSMEEIRGQFEAIWKKFGLEGSGSRKIGLIVASVALNGTAENALGTLDLLVGMELEQTKAVPDEALKEALALLWKLSGLQHSDLTYSLSFKHGQNFRSATMKVSSTKGQPKNMPAGFDSWTVLSLDSALILVGPEASVWKALQRYQGKQAAVLDPYLANNLSGDCAFAMRMLPAMRQFFQAMEGPDTAAVAALGKGDGLAFNGKMGDRLDMELSFQCAKAADAVAFKKSVWDTQAVLVVGMVGGMLKAQSNNDITCFDSLRCEADGRVIRIKMPLTIRDIDGFANYIEKERLAQEAAAKQAAAKQAAPVKKTAVPAGK